MYEGCEGYEGIAFFEVPRGANRARFGDLAGFESCIVHDLGFAGAGGCSLGLEGGGGQGAGVGDQGAGIGDWRLQIGDLKGREEVNECGGQEDHHGGAKARRHRRHGDTEKKWNRRCSFALRSSEVAPQRFGAQQ